MDVEGTIDFILQMQARHEENFAKHEARTTKAEARMDAMDQRFDRRMNAIGKLIQQGMKTLVALDKRMNQLTAVQEELATAQKAMTVAVRDLAACQKATDKKFQAFLDGLRKGGNGRNGRSA